MTSRATLWTEKETEYLKENYILKSYPQIAFNLNRTIPSIKARLKKLGLRKLKKKMWTEHKKRNI